MTFDSTIQQTETSTLTELYELTAGNTIYRFTNNLKSVTFQSNVFEPGAFQRSNFTREETLKEVTVNITSGVTSAVQIYLTNSPAVLTGVKIWRAFVENPSEFRLIFNGVIRSVTVENLVATAVCVSLNKLRRTKLPRFVYQSTCNHQLFDSNCGLNENTYKTVASGVVISGNGRIITHSNFSNIDPSYFLLGQVEFEGERRLIVKHDGTNLHIQQPFDSRAISGVTMNAFPGCDKLADTCINKYLNFAKFLGFAYIPNSNIVLWGFQK